MLPTMRAVTRLAQMSVGCLTDGRDDLTIAPMNND